MMKSSHKGNLTVKYDPSFGELAVVDSTDNDIDTIWKQGVKFNTR